MEKIVKNWRYWLMGAIALLAALNIIALPSPEEEHFWLVFIGSKVAAWCCCTLMCACLCGLPDTGRSTTYCLSRNDGYRIMITYMIFCFVLKEHEDPKRGKERFFSSLTLTILVFERMLRLPVKVALTNGDAGRGTDRAQKA